MPVIVTTDDESPISNGSVVNVPEVIFTNEVSLAGSLNNIVPTAPEFAPVITLPRINDLSVELKVSLTMLFEYGDPTNILEASPLTEIL